jgi:hypothetical protein
MNVSVAVLVGAALIAGSVVWAVDHVTRDVRCWAYLASTGGSNELRQHAEFEANRAKRGAMQYEAEQSRKAEIIAELKRREVPLPLGVQEVAPPPASEGNSQPPPPDHSKNPFGAGLRAAGCYQEVGS